MVTTTDRLAQLATVRDHLGEARQVFALLTLITDAFTEHPPSDLANEDIPRWGWCRINSLCHEGYNHIDAALDALRGEAAAVATGECDG